MNMKNKKSYEESVKRLHQIVAELEKTDISLEQSMMLFEEGVVLVKECGEVLENARQKVEQLSGSIKFFSDEVE